MKYTLAMLSNFYKKDGHGIMGQLAIHVLC